MALGGRSHRAVRGLPVGGQGAGAGDEGVCVQPVPGGLLGRGRKAPPHHYLLQHDHGLTNIAD